MWAFFSFLSISPQFAYQSSHKASDMWSHMGEGLRGTILHALDMFLGYFGAFCEFFAVHLAICSSNAQQSFFFRLSPWWLFCRDSEMTFLTKD